VPSDDEVKKRPTPSVRPPPSGAPSRASSRPPPPSRISQAALRLSAIDYELVNASRRILDSSLSVVPGERVVLVVDGARRDVLSSLSEIAATLGATPVPFELEKLGHRPHRQLHEEIDAALAGAQASVFLAAWDDGEATMRADLLSRVRRHMLRHAHMPGVTRQSLIAGFSADPARVLDATRAVRTRLRPDSTLRLRTPSGSDLEVRLSPSLRWVEHVGVIRPGRWENLPSGSLVTAPHDVKGSFVCDASLGEQLCGYTPALARSPLRLELDGGVCRAVRCADLGLQRAVEDAMRKEHGLDRVGLVVLGTNVGIVAPVGEALCDQNLPGLHLSFGATLPDLTGASWSARSCLTMTCAGSDVDLDGAPLLRSARYMVG
jgi:leucyl aminopeptidase (aminopeptidase T)